jgi:hypothetical protein
MKKIIFLISLIFVLYSCSTEDSSEDSNNNEVVLLKKLEQSNDLDIEYYKYNGTKLNYVSIGDESGQIWRLQFTYSGDLITKTEWFENNQPTGEKDVNTYSNNKLSEVRIYSPGAILEYIENYTYNSDGTVDIITEGFNGNSGGFVKIFIDSNNNTIKKDYLGGYVKLFEFDNKNNPYKNITGLNKIFSLGGRSVGNNNITKEIMPYGNKLFNYQYNSQNYPISCELLETGQSPVVYTFYY